MVFGKPFSLASIFGNRRDAPLRRLRMLLRFYFQEATWFLLLELKAARGVSRYNTRRTPTDARSVSREEIPTSYISDRSSSHLGQASSTRGENFEGLATASSACTRAPRTSGSPISRPTTRRLERFNCFDFRAVKWNAALNASTALNANTE